MSNATESRPRAVAALKRREHLVAQDLNPEPGVLRANEDPARASQISDECAELDRKITLLGEVITVLRDRLARVLMPAPETALAAAQPADDVSPLAADIRLFAARVNMTTEVVRDILERLEL
jgi:hypothetical protein